MVFDASFTASIPTDYMEKELKPKEMYCLLFKMTQTMDEVMHHHVDLEKSHITAEVKNLSQNSEMYP
jgi:hypothetical protein